MRIESDGSAVLTGRRSKTDQEGQGAYAWLSPDIMRRLAAWREASGILDGPLFRRIGLVRTKARAAAPTAALPPPPEFQWRVPAGAKVSTESKSVLGSTTYPAFPRWRVV